MLTVIGMGNVQFGDDGIGPAIIENLRATQRLTTKTTTGAEIELIEMGLDALGLLDYLPNRNQVLIVDAARMGAKPGTMRVFKPTESHLVLQWDHLSLHGFGLAETYRLAGELGILPEQFWILGIQPGNVNPGTTLSPAVSTAIPNAVRLIRQLARHQPLASELPTMCIDQNGFA